MSDMLVKLFDLEGLDNPFAPLKDRGVKIRRAIPPEKNIISEWISNNFYKTWAAEAEIAMAASPPKIFIAVKEERLLGFACYDTTAKGFFGPTGVGENARKKGIGTALLLKSLKALKETGYVYAIIGDAGPVEYYKKICEAQVIKNSRKSIYQGMLK